MKSILRISTISMTASRRAGPMIGTLGTLVTALFLISAAAAEETTPAPPAAELFPDLTADLQMTLIDSKGHTSLSTVRIHRSGKSVRYEHTETDPPEVSIIDFDKMKEYRIYAGDKIYFESPISNRSSFKAQREGLIPAESNPNLVEKRVFLREDTLEGHPCEIILRIRSIKDQKEAGSDYTLLWEARDLNRQPLRVAYYQGNSTFSIVDLRNIRLGPVDPALLQPPAGFASMNPY